MNNRENLIFELLIDTEDLKTIAYPDSRKPPIITIGIGTTRYPDGSKIKIGDTCTTEQAKQWCNEYLKKNVYPRIDNLFHDNLLPDRVYAALCSFIYNEGHMFLDVAAAIANSLARDDWSILAKEMIKYDYVQGKHSKGLLNRRKKEIKFFMGKE